ncbi:protein NRT1/ PTR FAMILY 1.1 isoform X3 [Setaria viridis]|nr:protein NRT1/ PTR FAMILY 1.1-like isoform X3 [Setaria viridis]XP_034594100.1 protein NRT1/ PTR FAMILY 1.1-like isoform X3 [Setaria viridis]
MPALWLLPPYSSWMRSALDVVCYRGLGAKMELEDQDGDGDGIVGVRGQGGIRALPCIFANEMLEKVAGFGLNTNMITYLTNKYHLSTVTSQTMLFVWSAASNFAPIPGAVVADMYLGRFMAVALGSISCLIGIVFLWLSATIPGARPPPCSSGEHCAPPGARHLAWLLAGFAFLSVGAGGVRPCSMAFGADQFSRHPKERRSRILQAYFNAYYASIGVAFSVAVTAIVYLQDNVGWSVGFAVPMGLMLLSTVSFFLGSGLYIKEKGKRLMFSGIGAAVGAAIRNHRARLPAKTGDGVYHHLKDCKLTVPTDQLRFLNKACMIGSTEEGSGSPSNSGRRPCTVDQVEQLKSAIRVLPIWSSTIFLALAMNQSFAVKQADTMDRRVGKGRFQVPSGSLALFNMATMSLWSASYDRWVAPALRWHTGNPRGLTMKQRIGGGLLLATASSAVSAVVEGARRRQALSGDTISAFWLVPQFALVGLAEAFGVIGEIEFFYTELPKSMASFSMSLLYMAFGVGNLAGALIVKVVQVASRRGGNTSWLVDDLNAGHYDYYYWLLTGYGVVNFVYFAWCCWVYGEEGKNVEWEEDDDGDQPIL